MRNRPSQGKLTELINTRKRFDKFMADLWEHKVVACDTETTGLEFFRHELLGFSFSISSTKNVYIPILHNTGEKVLNAEYVLGRLREWFAQDDITTVWHNAKFDLLFLRAAGIDVGGTLHDTMLLHFMLDENGSHKLETLAIRHLPEADGWKDVIPHQLKLTARQRKVKMADLNYGHIPLDILGEYAALDARFTYLLYSRFIDQLESHPHFSGLYTLEMDLLRVLFEKEYRGVYIDEPYLHDLSGTLRERIDEVEDEFQQIAGRLVNMNSPKQLIELFDDHDIPVLKRTAKGAPCLDRGTLLRLADVHKAPLAKLLLEHRKARKILSTYSEAIPLKLDTEKRLHTTYRQASARSSRLSSANPNLQNIPRGPEIRRAFVPPSDEYVIVCIDFSQIELRLTAHMSQDPKMLKNYGAGGDIHMMTAMGLTGKPASKVTKEERTNGKVTNFSVLYGAGPRTLVETAFTGYGVKWTEKQAKGYIDQFYKHYRGVRRWKTDLERKIRMQGYVDDYFGRRRRAPDIKDVSIEKWKRESRVRSLVNFTIQSPAATMLKRSIVRVDNLLKEENAKTKMFLNVHDEIAFYLHQDEFYLLPEIVHEMQDWDFDIPILVDVDWSEKSWGDKRGLAD